jgi:MFS family permease
VAIPAPKTKPGVFYGWWVTLSCVVILTMSSGPGFYCFAGVFASVFTEDFGWSRGLVGGAIALYWLVGGFVGPVVGKWVVKFGARRVALCGAVIMGFSLIALSQTGNWVYLYAVKSILAVGMAASGIIALGAVVSCWFIRRRGIAMGTLALGISFGGLILVPITEYLRVTFSWQWAYIILGLMEFGLCIPLILLVIKEHPEEMGLMPDGDEPGEKVAAASSSKSIPVSELWTIKEALRTGAFWLISFSILLAYMALFGTLAHQKLYHVDIGYATTAAAIIYSITAGMGSLGKLGFGLLSDKIRVKYVAALCFGLQAIGVLLLMASSNPTILWVYVILYGVSMGGVAALQPLLVVAAFGPASFAVIYAMAALIFHFGNALGPWAAGWIFDVTGSYKGAFIIFCSAYVMATVGVLAIQQPKKSTPTAV